MMGILLRFKAPLCPGRCRDGGVFSLTTVASIRSGSSGRGFGPSPISPSREYERNNGKGKDEDANRHRTYRPREPPDSRSGVVDQRSNLHEVDGGAHPIETSYPLEQLLGEERLGRLF